MIHSAIAPEDLYAAVVEALLGSPGVTPPSAETESKRFGASGLKVDNKIFAMLVRSRLVVKLPRQRVDALIASGSGEHYDPRRDGRLMKEWVAVEPTSEQAWLSLAREALAFVGSRC